MKYISKTGDQLDYIAYKQYGTESATLQILNVNPGLAAHGPILPAGLKITLPEISQAIKKTVSLWD